MITMDQIIREGHPTLRKKAEEMNFPLTQEEKTIAAEMLEFLKNSQDPEKAEKYGLRAGIGIAANQIDVPKRMFALHMVDEGTEPLSMTIINPKIVSHSAKRSYLPGGEGCLSVDRDVPGFVPRYSKITVKGFTPEGEPIKKRLKGLQAIAFQHELDHLNGVMFYDHIDPDKPFREYPDAEPLNADEEK
ncbi:peptide deformylase [Bhargavaea cecembensis]|uniref:Peptide deformylase n=1 Tax=Bhargavaea cecembensis TaxID=394098 RepID=A0A161RJA6_9BACL|nr:peptide deformylase [Bhargavaea cecembensis]KZE38288.1 peptide deformylase [Bhargavaea cecembensis]